MSSIESQRYKPDLQYNSLALMEPYGADRDLQYMAMRELDFTRLEDIRTKKAHWQVYDRPNHEIPNFPDTATTVHSSLALYIEVLSPIKAILRTSLEAYPQEEFVKDLDAFTRNYVERPKFWGFPSRALARVEGALPAMGVGTVLGGVPGYLLTGEILNWGLVGGMAVGEFGFMGGWALSERYAKRQISDLTQYTVGNNARNVLYKERDHRFRVAIQKELYAALQDRGFDLSPEEFLNKIYGQMPPELIKKRKEEIEASRDSDHFVQLDGRNTLPRLVEVARILQAG